MTKGNFEARCERAQRKKAAARAEKEERQLGLRVDPDVMLAKLFRHDPDAAVFLSLPDSQMQSEGQKLCWLHFHEEACENRRCKWSHRKDMRVCLARVVRLCLLYVRVLFLMLRSNISEYTIGRSRMPKGFRDVLGTTVMSSRSPEKAGVGNQGEGRSSKKGKRRGGGGGGSGNGGSGGGRKGVSESSFGDGIRTTEPCVEFVPPWRARLWPPRHPSKLDDSRLLNCGNGGNEGGEGAGHFVPLDGAIGPFFAPLPDAVITDGIFSFAATNHCVAALAAACASLRLAALDSNAVHRRKLARMPILIAARNRGLLKGQSARRLRYVLASASASLVPLPLPSCRCRFPRAAFASLVLLSLPHASSSAARRWCTVHFCGSLR